MPWGCLGEKATTWRGWQHVKRSAVAHKSSPLSQTNVRATPTVAAQICIQHMIAPASVNLQVALRNTFVFEARLL